MLSGFYQWLLYFSSYGLLFLLYALDVICISVSKNNENVLFLWKVFYAITDNCVLLLILLSLFVISGIIAFSIKKWKNNTRIYVTATANQTKEVLWMITSFIIPLGVCAFNTYLGLLTLFLLLLIGVIVIRGGYLYSFLVFPLMGYSIYSNSDIKIISKYKMEKMNLLIDESKNGLEAREISKGVYIIIEKRRRKHI